MQRLYLEITLTIIRHIENNVVQIIDLIKVYIKKDHCSYCYLVILQFLSIQMLEM